MIRPAAYITAPAAITRRLPKRSAIAPANGCPIPHSRFWIASARPNTSRPQENSRLIGCMKKPKVERGPNVSMPIRQPHTTITSGVRQAVAEEGRRGVASVAVIQFPDMVGADRTRDVDVRGRKSPANQRPAKLMHRHGNPNGEVGKAFDGNAALQFTAGSCDDLAAWSAGEALACMLYVICSL